MIVFFSDCEINRLAIHSLTRENSLETQSFFDMHLHGKAESSITLLDLTADGNFQNLLSPERLAIRLIESGFSHHISRIDLIVSDISLKKPLIPYAYSLIEELFKRGYLISEIRVPAVLEGFTFITPPGENTKEWSVFSLNIETFLNLESSPENKAHFFSTDVNFYFYKNQFKEKIFSGNNIYDFFTEFQCAITSDEVINTRDELLADINPYFNSHSH